MIAAVIQPRIAQLSVIWLGMLSMSFYNIQPVLVGGFVTQLGLSDAGAGLVVISNVAGACTALIAAALVNHNGKERSLVAIALSLIAIGSIMSGLATSLTALLAIRAVAGMGEGYLAAFVAASIPRFRNPDRTYALVVITMSIYGVMGFLLFPPLLDRYGLLSVFGGIAALALLSFALLQFLPAPNPRHHHGSTAAAPHLYRAPTLLILLSLMALYTSANSLWTYYERIGAHFGIPSAKIGVSLSLGLGASLLGSTLIALVAKGVGRAIPIAIGLLLALSATVVLLLDDGYAAYTASVMMIFGSVGFMIPSYFGLLATRDPAGRLMILGTVGLWAGNISGPALGASLLTSVGYNGLISVSGVLFLLALLAASAAAFKMHHRGGLRPAPGEAQPRPAP
ncbi:MFS transporter [Pseudohaliea sp.]|uniref:MFS transporter n=1 Tax=Pseudohaliea sp. TaxID=2740289 RepID=UPI0032EC1DCE